MDYLQMLVLMCYVKLQLINNDMSNVECIVAYSNNNFFLLVIARLSLSVRDV